MKYIIDEDKLYDLVNAEVSFAADGAYDKNGSPLFDGIVLTSKDGDMVKRLMHDAASRLVGRMPDIAKFSADLEEKKSEPTRKLLTAKPVLRASSSSETILVDNTDWLQGLGAISVKKDIYLSQGAGSILVGYNNRYGAYLTTYFGEYLEPDTPDWITMEQVVVDNQTCFRFTFEENVTGASRKTRFFMFLNARDPKSGKMGSEYFGIGIDIIQVGGEDKYVTIGSIESFGYDGGRQIIPITFSDGSSVLDHVQNGDIDASYVLRDWEVNPNLWFTFAFVEGGIAIECEKNYSIYENNLGGTTYTPYKERSKPMIISVANVLNAQSKFTYIGQEAAPVDPDETSPYETPYAVKKSTQIELDAAGETKVDAITPNKAGDFTITVLDTANIPSWLTVQVSGNSMLYTCEANTTGEMRKATVEFIVRRVGTGDSATTATFIYQPSSFEMIDLGISSDPKAIYFKGEFDNAHPEGKVVKPVIPNGYGFKFDVHGDFFRASYYYGQIDVYLTSANDTGAVKPGTIEIYLTSQTTGERIPGIESFPVDVYQLVKTATTTEGDAGQAGQSEKLMISCKPGPNFGEFEFGVNGGDKAFDKFWWTGGNITNIVHELTPSWFTLRKDSKYINTDTSDSKTHYNPYGYYIHCEKNETSVERRSYVEVTIKGSGTSTETSKIYVNQAAAEIQPNPVDPDPEHPVPVITCADTINVPASGYDGVMVDGKVHVFLPITLENTDYYTAKVVRSVHATRLFGGIKKYDDGVSIECYENDGDLRTGFIEITAYNQNGHATKIVSVAQAGTEDQQPVPRWYAKVDKDSFVIKSVPDADDLVVVNIDSNISSVDFSGVSYDGGSTDWLQMEDAVDNHYEFSAGGYNNLTGADRVATIWFDYSTGDGVEGNLSVTVRQLAKPKITLAKDSEDNFTWAGGKIEVPISLVGLQFADIYIKEKGIWVDPAIDAAGRKLIVSVAQNTSNAERGHIIVLEGTNELGETATATFTINQGKPPVYTGGDSEEEGEGGETTGTGKDAIEFDVPDFDLNELVGTPYNQEGVFRTISRYFVLFSCMKIFQERYPELVQVYTERAQSAMDDINNIIRQRKRPKR